MHKLLLLSAMLLYHPVTNAQECRCLSQFSFVKKYYEDNSPAFQKIKNNHLSYRNYTREVKKLVTELQHEKSPDRCNIYFERYVELLRDHHSGIDLNIKRLPVDFSSAQVVDSFKATIGYRSYKKIKIDPDQLIREAASKGIDDVEGLYTNGGITVAIKRSFNSQYDGIVVKETKLLEIGHVLFEFDSLGENTFECIYHTGLMGLNFQNVYKKLVIKNGQIPELGFQKTALQKTTPAQLYSFQQLDDSTNYIRLASFSQELRGELDSFYHEIDLLVQARPFLIIDLRDNGGGAEACYLDLVKYFYTKPLQIDRVDVWVSPDNIKRYEESGWNPTLIRRMKVSKKFTFIPQIDHASENWIMDGTKNPKKIVILYNRGTASAAEGMITYAIQSDKVVTLGDYSGGYIGYGDVMKTDIPCGKYSLRCTTTKYSNNSAYEFKGIRPMIILPEKEDWLEAAKKVLTSTDSLRL